jgi:hypothetical protein
MPRGGEKLEQPSNSEKGNDEGRQTSAPSSAAKKPAAGRASKSSATDEEEQRPTSVRGRGRGRGRGGGGNISNEASGQPSSAPLSGNQSEAHTMPRGGEKVERPPNSGKGNDGGRSAGQQNQAVELDRLQASSSGSTEAAASRQTSAPSSAAKKPAAGRASKSSATDEEEQRPTSVRGRGRGRGRGGCGNISNEASGQPPSASLIGLQSENSTHLNAFEGRHQRSKSADVADQRNPINSLPSSGAEARDISTTDRKVTDELDKRLKKRIKELTLKQTEVKENADLVNTLTEEIVKDLNERESPKLKWRQRNSGSYYDRTKVFQNTRLY